MSFATQARGEKRGFSNDQKKMVKRKERRWEEKGRASFVLKKNRAEPTLPSLTVGTNNEDGRRSASLPQESNVGELVNEA